MTEEKTPTCPTCGCGNHTNKEAQILANMERIENLPYAIEITYKRGTPKSDSALSVCEQLHNFLEIEYGANTQPKKQHK